MRTKDKRARKLCRACRRMVPKEQTYCWYCGHRPWYWRPEIPYMIVLSLIVIGLIVTALVMQSDLGRPSLGR